MKNVFLKLEVSSQSLRSSENCIRIHEIRAKALQSFFKNQDTQAKMYYLYDFRATNMDETDIIGAIYDIEDGHVDWL